MQAARHAMALVERSGSQLVFLCEEASCGRRLVIDTRDAGLVVIDQGDRTALHGGGTGGVTLHVSVQSGGDRDTVWTSEHN